ncbi:MAG: hypothetical protein JKY51_03485 [Opitutaceae bacterium]|nr:hypothetical protein [Opitutaceae bacterium]
MLKIISDRLYRTDIKARMPFKYGIATMVEVPHVFLEISLSVNGKEQKGISADHLPPKWFTKDPDKDPLDEISEMLDVIHHAMNISIGEEAETPFELWQKIYKPQLAWGIQNQYPPLLSNFGTTLIERALLDAFCKGTNETFFSAVKTNSLGIDLGKIHSELSGSSPLDYLDTAPPTSVFARHTVGLADPLMTDDIIEAERLHDGLPQSLEENIHTYGLRHFKLKINGQQDTDIERLIIIAKILKKNCTDYSFSIDGNESFHDVASFAAFWQKISIHPQLSEFLKNLLFIEQPFHRSLALSDSIGEMTSSWPDRPPIIIDESDAELGSLPKALHLGYAGTSHKNCKGVFKGLANACLLRQKSRENPSATYLMSGEDLSNIGPVALIQDLVVQMSLGITSIERNGHHYFKGLSFFPQSIQSAVLKAHPDLYQASGEGWPQVAIKEGMLSTKTLVEAPFGTGFGDLPLDSFELIYEGLPSN